MAIRITNKDVIQSYLMTVSKYNFSVYEKRIVYRLVEAMQCEIEGKKLFAFLGVLNPILCFCSETDDYDAGKVKIMEIGTKEEFNYRRRQIQEAARRCQAECKYSNGGKGRKRKTAAIERFQEKEYHYVDTKLHTYSKMLIDYAVKNGCGEIVLLNQLHREEKANDDNMEGDNFVLRNWSYSGLKNKIEYKAKLNGIIVTSKQ